MVAVGIWLLVSERDFDFITDSIYASPAALLIVAGAITVIVSIVGIIGAIGMWWCVIVLYICILVVVIVLQIVAGILGAVFRENLRSIIGDRIEEAIVDYRFNSSSDGFESDVNSFINTMQEELDCCGFNGPSDWFNTTFFNESGGSFPESCECEQNDTNENCAPFQGTIDEAQTMQLIWNEGCDDEIVDRLQDNLVVIAGVGTAFGLFQISGVAVALGLCICACMDRKNDDDFVHDTYVY